MIAEQTESIQRDLARLTNGVFADKRQYLLAAIGSRPFYIDAERFVSLRLNKPDSKPPPGDGLDQESAPIRISLERYSGANIPVNRLQGFLDSRLTPEDVVGCYVHGSLATGDEVPYSDFDALVVLRDRILRDPYRLAMTSLVLNQSRKFMVDQDPLQHHGWFVLTESDFVCYPDYYLPVDTLRRAKVLFGNEELIVRPHYDQARSRDSLRSLCDAIGKELRTGQYQHNLYSLKSLTSKIMLLPSIYLQARSGIGIYKSESYSIAESEFPPEQWVAIQGCSEIRQQWPRLRIRFRRTLFRRPSIVGKIAAKRLSPRIPAHLSDRLRQVVLPSVGALMEAMKQRVG